MRYVIILIVVLVIMAGVSLATTHSHPGQVILVSKHETRFVPGEKRAFSSPASQEILNGVRAKFGGDFQVLSKHKTGNRATAKVMISAEHVFFQPKEGLFEGMTIAQVKGLLGQPYRAQEASDAPRWLALHYVYMRGEKIIKATLSFQDGRCYAHMFSSSTSAPQNGAKMSIDFKHIVGPPPWLIQDMKNSRG